MQLKKLELEFSVDPLFKKASADFDEGGAKGLLLNHLMIDSQGRIVFDSSDDAGDAATVEREMEGDALDEDKDRSQKLQTTAEFGDNSAVPDTATKTGEEGQEEADHEIDLASLRQRFLASLDRLDELDVCPSLKTFDLGDPSGSMGIPFLRAPEDWRNEQEKEKTPGVLGDSSGLLFDEEGPLGFEDDLGLGSFDIGGDVEFGGGGEAWARNAALEPPMRPYNGEMGEGEADGEGFRASDDYAVSMSDPRRAEKMHEDILGFFDQALQKNWTSAEHWRIRKVKDANKPAAETKKRKEKEPFEIDFDSALDPAMADTIYTQATSNSAISMAKKDWKSKSRNLLPDDKHFNSKSLLTLFLKPRAKMRRQGVGFRGVFGTAQADEPPEGDMDEAFWAQRKAPMHDGDDTMLPAGEYDANFFQDDALPFPGADDGDDDDLEFADAREQFTPGMDGDPGMTTDGGGFTAMLNGETTTAMGAFGTTLVTQARRVRPDYVQYARVAKKVDVRRLKEEMWKGLAFEDTEVSWRAWPGSLASQRKPLADKPIPPQEATRGSRLLTPPEAETESKPKPAEAAAEGATYKFTSVMRGLQTVYPKPVMDDISTSFCFICLLHLANEKGLVIDSRADLMELDIRKDWTAQFIEGET